jgi:hypothetical protein
MEVGDENVLEKKSREGSVPGVRMKRGGWRKIGVMHGLLYLGEDQRLKKLIEEQSRGWASRP